MSAFNLQEKFKKAKCADLVIKSAHFIYFLCIRKLLRLSVTTKYLDNSEYQNGSGPKESDIGGGGMLPFFFNGSETSKPMLSTRSDASLIKPVEVLNLA